jgi:hypothetical protein
MVESYFIYLVDQCSQGYFKLPFDLTSAIYQLEIKVFSDSSLKDMIIGSADLSIYNDEDLPKFVSALETVGSVDYSVNQLTTREALQVQTREPIHLDIALPDGIQSKIKRVSMVVRDQHLYGAQTNNTYQTQTLRVEDKLLSGIPVFGTRKIINPGSIKSQLLFAFNPFNMHYNGTKVAAQTGEFNLKLSPFYKEQEITFLDYVDDEIMVTEKSTLFHSVHPDTLLVDANIIDHLKAYREEKQINRIFKQIALPVRIDSSDLGNIRKKPNFHIDVQDYTIRGTCVDLFKELATNLKFRSAGADKYQARMLYEYNGITKFYSRAPLFLVNGRATRDGNFIAHIPLQEIGYISIYSNYEALQRLSPIAHGGIVYVEMMDQHYALTGEKALPVLTVQGLQVPILYPIRSSVKDGSPATGSLLYWHPNLQPDGDRLQIDFTSNDIATEYLVEAVLFLKDGQQEVIREWIKVGPQ